MTSRLKRSFLALVVFIFSNISYADDIDILTAETLVDANILFVMDLSGSMDTVIDGGTATRLEELSGAFQAIVTDDSFSKVNFGLSVFSGDALGNKGKGLAHGITYPVSPIIGTPAQDILSKTGFTHPDNSYMPVAGTNNTRQYLSLLSSDTNIWSAGGSTPIVDALFEAARYFRGEEVLWGRYGAEDIRSAHPSSYAGTITTVANTVTPACTEASRQSCISGSCGVTESCSSTASTEWSATDTGGCTIQTDNRQTCATGDTSCGLGTSCTDTTSTNTRFCNGSGDISACESANPSWYACETYTNTNTTYDNEDQPVYSSTEGVKCKEDVTRTRCDAADSYRCPTTIESCTQCPEDETTYSVSGSGIYKSPIIQECAANAIILLTDGAPTSNRSADDIATLIGSTYANGCNAGSEAGRCAPELAKFMASEDHANGSTSVANIDGIQNVKTYAVGLALDLTDPVQTATKVYLDDISMNGNGRPAIIAENKEELTKAFQDSINSAIGKARSFSSPSYSIDTSTLLTNGPYVYIPVFDRSNTLWPGNLKKFKLVDGVLTDADNSPALDSSNALLDTARDFWSASGDIAVDSITSGGAANKITPSTRNILTDDGTQLIGLSNSITNSDFGLSTSTADTNYKAELVTFISGANPSDNSVRNHMGDIIHSKPVQLEMSNGRKIIFVGSNEGYLHAINDYESETDLKNGTEAFAYMPKELLKNIKDQYSGVPLPKHIYGVDGLITVWIDESTNTNNLQVGNSVLDVVNGEKAYVFFGLRRGGGSYTALEVTDPDNPRLVWSNTFGTGNSWSQPVVANLKWQPNATEKPVIIIGGGFNDDTSGSEIAGGNNVYVIDALTGATVWDTTTAFTGSKVTNYSGSSLPNAVPAKIRTIDIDRNNSIDRLYFGDTGGNIWRVDLNASNFDDITTNDNDLTKATLHRIAALGGAGTDNRKFFESPDIAIFKSNGKLVTSIAIGSGDRPNPLSADISDKFFVIYDLEALTLPTEPLITLSTGQIKTVPVSKSDQLDSNYRGWQKTLNTSTGEKVLSSALTFQGKILFTSFATLDITPDACNPSNTNVNTLYVIDIFAGTEDLATTYPGGEILDTPKIIFPEGGTCVIGDCTRDPKIGFGKIVIDFPVTLDEDGNPILDSAGNAVSGGGNTLERVYWIDSEK